MTHRPIGSIWEYASGNKWKVEKNLEGGRNLCKLLSGPFSRTIFIGSREVLYIDEGDKNWKLVYTPKHTAFTDKEYEELLV